MEVPDVPTARLGHTAPTDLYSQIARGAQTLGTATVPERIGTPPAREPDAASRHDPVLVAESIQAGHGGPSVRPSDADLRNSVALTSAQAGSNGADAGPQAPTSIRQDFKDRADTLRSAVQATKREQWLARSKNALFYTLIVLVLAGVLLLLIRPSFVYSKEDEWSGPVLSLWRVIGIALIVAVVVFGYVLFMGR